MQNYPYKNYHGNYVFHLNNTDIKVIVTVDFVLATTVIQKY